MAENEDPPVRRWLLFVTGALACLVLAAFIPRVSGGGGPPPEYRGTIRVGWEEHYPYHFVDGTGSLAQRTGLDTELITRAFARAGFQVEWVDGRWGDLSGKLHRGEIQAMSIALKTPQREIDYQFSDAYFEQYFAVYYRLVDDPPPAEPTELLEFCRQQKLKLGFTRGYAYPPGLQEVLDDPEVKLRAVEVESDKNGLEDLVDGRIDLFFAGELIGSSTMQRNGWDDELGRVHANIAPQPVYVMLNRSVPPEVVLELNQALAQMDESGEKAACVRAYFYPSLLAVLTESPILREIGILAAGFAAISGIFMAYRDKLNLVGAFILASAPAAGGGILRDLISGRRPVAVVADPLILLTVAFLTLLLYFFFELLERFPGRLKKRVDALDVDRSPLLVLFDSLGMGFYTVLGVLVAMQTHCEPLWLWGPLLAACTNGGGSILRDIIRGIHPIPILRSFYLQTSIVWGFALSWFFILYSNHQPHELHVIASALIVTMAGVVAMRGIVQLLENRR